MLFKQCIWRGNGIIISIAILISVHCFGADDENFLGESKQILDCAYEIAPRKVQRIVNTLLGDRGPRSYPLNYAIFAGDPGVGKSTLALSVAYKAGWDIQKYGSNDFIKTENRNGTSAEFNTKMLDFINSHEKTVIIVEEVNHLLMNHDSKHHDTDSSSVSLWLFLDKIKTKQNLFFIGTTNGLGGFPPQIRSRFKPSIVKIKADWDLDFIKNMLLDGLSGQGIVVDNGVKNYLDGHSQLLEGYTARDIKSLVYEIRGKADDLSEDNGDNDQLIIKPEHVEAAFNSFAELEIDFNARPYNETDNEQRERQHKESLTQAAQLNVQNIQLQEKIARDGKMLQCSNMIIVVGGLAITIYFASIHHRDMMEFHRKVADLTQKFQEQGALLNKVNTILNVGGVACKVLVSDQVASSARIVWHWLLGKVGLE